MLLSYWSPPGGLIIANKGKSTVPGKVKISQPHTHCLPTHLLRSF